MSAGEISLILAPGPGQLNLLITQVSPVIRVALAVPGPVGATGPKGVNSVAKAAARNLSGHRLVAVSAAETVDYADQADDSALRLLGMTTGAAEAGAAAEVLLGGEISEPSWNWAMNAPVYLGSAGLLTQTAPLSGYLVQVGLPMSPTTMLLGIRSPISLV